MRHLLFISSLLLLFLALAPLSTPAQLKAQPKLPPSEASTVPPASNPPAAMKRTISVILPNALDVKKLKPGDSFTANVASGPFFKPARARIVIRIEDAYPRGKGRTDSQLVLRFEKAVPGPNSGAPLHLELQSVASPSWIDWSVPLVIEDRFPCDPKVARSGCDEQDKYEEDRANSEQMLFCNPKAPKNNPAQRDCASPEGSNGIYGYPDLSLSPGPNSPDTFVIASSKRKVKLDKGTYLVLSGPDVAAVLH